MSDARQTTSSSSARATTASSPRPTSPRPAARCWCSSAATSPAASWPRADARPVARRRALHAVRAAAAGHRARSRPRAARPARRRGAAMPYVAPLPDGGSLHLVADGGDAATLASIRRLSARDAAALARVRRVHERGRRVSSTPPTRTPMPRLPRVGLAHRRPAARLARAEAAPPRPPRHVPRDPQPVDVGESSSPRSGSSPSRSRRRSARVAIHGVTLGSMSAGTGYTLMHQWLNRGGLAHRPVPGGADAVATALVAGAAGARRRSAHRRRRWRRSWSTAAARDRRAPRERRGDPRPARSSRPPTRATRCSAWSARPSCRRSSSGRRSRSACAARSPRCTCSTDGQHGLPDGTIVVAPTLQVPGARLRRRQVRRDVRAAVPRSHDRGRRRLDPLPVRAVRAAPGRLGRAAARTRARARSTPWRRTYPAFRGSVRALQLDHAARPRAGLGPDRGRPEPRPADPRPGVLHATAARLVRSPHAGRRPVPVRQRGCTAAAASAAPRDATRRDCCCASERRGGARVPAPSAVRRLSALRRTGSRTRGAGCAPGAGAGARPA